MDVIQRGAGDDANLAHASMNHISIGVIFHHWTTFGDARQIYIHPFRLIQNHWTIKVHFYTYREKRRPMLHTLNWSHKPQTTKTYYSCTRTIQIVGGNYRLLLEYKNLYYIIIHMFVTGTPASAPKGGVLFIHILPYSNIVDTTGKTIAIIDPRADLRCAIIICKETPGNNEGSTDPKHRNASQEEKQPKGHDLDR